MSADSSAQQSGPISGTMTLADADTKFDGAGANDTFGAALAHGDLNGDGVEDVVVGAPENDTASGNKSGAVYVFYGPVNESDLDAASANVTLTGVEESDRAGYSVATGDVNDDGTDDVVVGAPLNDQNGSSSGHAYVVHGGDLPENASLADANQTFVGASAGDRAGWSVATVNRSGGDDVLVGAPQNNSSGMNAGAVYVVSDDDTASLADATARLEGEDAGDLAGWSVAEAGDFDGNGSQDFVVGAMNNDSNAGEAGAAYVVTENVSGTESLTEASVKLAGDAARDHAGWSVAEAGDVNNDSYGDVVVGAPYNDQHGTSAGAAYVVHGGEDVTGTVNLTDAGTTLLGESESDQAGYDVSSAGSGDVTCDEYADVLVGAPGNNSTAPSAGAVYVVEGSEDPTAERNLSTATAKLVGEGEGDRAGHAVSDAEDATDNGSADVLVGAPRNDSDEVDTGAAYLIAGDCPEPKETDDHEETTAEPDTTEKPTTEEPTTTTASAPAAPTTEEPTTTSPTTTEEPEPEPENLLVAQECVDEQGEVTFTNPNDANVTLTFNDTEYDLAANGTDNDSVTIDDLDDGNYTWSAETEAEQDVGDGTITVDCDEEPAPAGSILNVTCENVTVNASDVAEENVTVQVEFENETNTTVTEATDENGTFNGTIDFGNSDNQNVTAVSLYAGENASGEALDNQTDLSIVCTPEPEEGPEEAPDAGNFDVNITETNSPVNEGDDLEVTIGVENTGEQNATQDVELADFDDETVDNESVSLDAEESTSLTLTWTTESGDVGTDDVTVSSDNDSVDETVTIETATDEADDGPEENGTIGESDGDEADDGSDADDADGSDADEQPADDPESDGPESTDGDSDGDESNDEEAEGEGSDAEEAADESDGQNETVGESEGNETGEDESDNGDAESEESNGEEAADESGEEDDSSDESDEEGADNEESEGEESEGEEGDDESEEEDDSSEGDEPVNESEEEEAEEEESDGEEAEEEDESNGESDEEDTVEEESPGDGANDEEPTDESPEEDGSEENSTDGSELIDLLSIEM